MHSQRVYVLLFLASFVFVRAAYGEERVKSPPELDILERYAGTWIVQQDSVEIKDRVEKCERIMAGRFVDCRTYLPTNSFGRIDTRMLLTYDDRTKSFRAWIEWSDGKYWEADGAWSEKTSTMTWIAKQPKGTRHFVTTFVGTHTLQWSIQDYDDAGKRGWGTGGTNKRKVL